MWRKARSVPLQVISNATIAVDTYFFLGGFLLAYSYLKNKIDKERINPINYKKKLNEFFVSIMKRYIRFVSNVILNLRDHKQRRCKHDSINDMYEQNNKKYNLTMNQIIIIAFFVVFKSKCFLLRLTPAYITMIGITQLTSAWYDKTSQFYVEERPHETCAKYWWRNVLYINNLFAHNTMVPMSI